MRFLMEYLFPSLCVLTIPFSLARVKKIMMQYLSLNFRNLINLLMGLQHESTLNLLRKYQY